MPKVEGGEVDVQIDGARLLKDVKKEFYSGELTSKLESFAEEHAYLIDLSLEENMLVYSDLHGSFNSIVEKHLEEVISAYGISAEDFF